MRVLLIEDEARLAGNVAAALREGPGFAVDCAEDGETGASLAGNHCYDLIILDLMLPRLNGVAVLQHIRAQKDHTPVLVLTARGEVLSKINLLNAGADDYLSKPFDLGELMARAKVLIRRGKGASHPVLRVAGIEVNTLEQTVLRGGHTIDLSPTEYRVLEYLMHRPRVVVSKRELLEHLYDYNWEHHSNVIEVHISNLRKKLEGSGQRSPIETLRGRGYRLITEQPAEQEPQA
jgi:DNA-binding response OmpR family regulator